MEELVKSIFQDSAKLKVSFAETHSKIIVDIAEVLSKAFKRGNKLLLFGNGGSASDTQHIAAEFVNRFKLERIPLPALSLATDSSVITSISNDYDFRELFSKQIMAFGIKGDIALGISTSGNSENILRAFEVAHRLKLKTVAFLGNDGGKARNKVDYPIIVPSDSVPRIQEVHITIGHILCELVENILFKKNIK